MLDGILALSAGQDPILKGLVDGEHVGLAGQSFGGWTTLHVMEHDPRFRAGVLLNPAISIQPPPDPSAVSRPMLFMAGDLDPMTPVLSLKEFYTRIPTSSPDHFLTVVSNAGHTFLDRCFPGAAVVPCTLTLAQDTQNRIVAMHATAFLLRYVADQVGYDEVLVAHSTNDYSFTRTATGSTPVPLPTTGRAPVPTRAVPAPTPAGAAGSVILTDGALASAAGGPTQYVQGYVDGEYVIRSPASLAPTTTFPNQVVSALPGAYANASLAVDVRLVDPRPGQWASIACRAQDEGARYQLSIHPSRTWAVTRLTYGTGLILAFSGTQPSPTVHPLAQTNRLELSCPGALIEASVNGVQMASISDSTFRDGRMVIGLGHSWFLAPTRSSPLTSPVEAHFTGLVVTQQ